MTLAVEALSLTGESVALPDKRKERHGGSVSCEKGEVQGGAMYVASTQSIHHRRAGDSFIVTRPSSGREIALRNRAVRKWQATGGYTLIVSRAFRVYPKPTGESHKLNGPKGGC